MTGISQAGACRRRVGFAMLLGAVAAAVWIILPGLPVMRGPSVNPKSIAQGKLLFEHAWQVNDTLAAQGGDGLGPVFNATSCADCHFQGGVGGGGPAGKNVLAYMIHPTAGQRTVLSGVVHAYAVNPMFQESPAVLRRQHPIIPGTVRDVNGCQVSIPSFDPILLESINTPALFGAGWIDRISAKSILHSARQQSLETVANEMHLDFGGVSGARVPRLPDGRLGKFGWRGQFATLEEFVAAACANEIGLGTPIRPQAEPLEGGYSSTKPDLDRSQFLAMVAFVATLPRPQQQWPRDPDERARSRHGQKLFHSVGCAQCHTPDVGGVEGIYSDFMLHRIDARRLEGDGYTRFEPEVPWPSDIPSPDHWQTPPLWGVADSAPYFHDGGSANLDEAIRRHGGSARNVTARYVELSPDDQGDAIAFLKTLRAPQAAPQAHAAEALASK